MVTVLGGGIYGGLRALGIALTSCTENLVLHGGAPGVIAAFGLWSGVSHT